MSFAVQLVVICCTARCHSLSLDVPHVCLFINNRTQPICYYCKYTWIRSFKEKFQALKTNYVWDWDFKDFAKSLINFDHDFFLKDCFCKPKPLLAANMLIYLNAFLNILDCVWITVNMPEYAWILLNLLKWLLFYISSL